ncbi:MAG: rhodanese-like domain-containing protein [Coriobacteriia bacterium]|nr:rhodanese-like domain-containing protein [Coriobacteriia bacterium]
MSKRFLGLILALTLAVSVLGALAGCATPPAEKPAEGTGTAPTAESARAKYLISVADLKASPDKFFVIDARDAKAYAAGHIAGAINLPWQPLATVAVGKPGDKDWGVLAAPQAIADALGKAGVDTAKTIVVYADPTGWGDDGRVVWSLQSIGLNGLMLDGGFPAWTAAGNTGSTDVPAVTPTTVTVAGDKLGDINVTTDQVKAAVADKSAKIIDARSEKEYGGATDFGEARGGRIPSAFNIPFASLFNEDGTVKSDADLTKLFEDAGLAKGDAVVVYCTKGIRSAYMTELMRMVGFEKAKNYDASFYTWAGDSTLTVEK